MTMLAQNTFTVKRATKDGYSCSLSSYSVMLNADSNGVVNGLSAASTTVKLYQGSTAVTPVISIDSVSNCSVSISGLNVSIASVPNNTKSGYIDIKIVYGSFVKIERYSFTVVDYTIVKSYTQSIVGDQMTSYATKKAVDTLGQTVSDHTTAIRQNSEDITLKASQKDVTDLGDRMKTAEASITPDAINLTVKSQIDKAVGNAQDEIKSSFSIGTDGISMLGKKISLAGMVSFKSLSDYSAVDGRINDAQTTADNAKNSLGTLTTSLGGLAYKSLVEQAMKEEGLISGAFIKMSLIDVKNVVAQGISAQTIDAGNATLKNLTVDTATVKMATLVKASGTFTELRCVNDKGSEVFSFNSTAVNIESVDMYNQGTKDGRALRFYASDIRCRGSLGAYTRNYVIVNMGIASYYVNGDTTSCVTVNLGTTTYNGRTYYMIPLYPAYGEYGLKASSTTGNCQINDVYGFPVDEVIIINNAGSYYYNLIGYAGKKVTLVNAIDSFNNNYFASCENAAHQLKGGVTMSLINVNPFFMSGSRTINSINKSCWMIAGWYDNDFN